MKPKNVYEELLKQAAMVLEEPLIYREDSNPYDEYFEERVEFAKKIMEELNND